MEIRTETMLYRCPAACQGWLYWIEGEGEEGGGRRYVGSRVAEETCILVPLYLIKMLRFQ